MNYIQGHVRKFKGSAVRQILNHNYRESNYSRDVIHPGKEGNVVVTKIGDYAMIRGRVQGRKNSVDMLDLVVSVSDDTGIPINEFHSDLTAWAKRKYGPGLVSVATHGDERTLHSHISLVPIVQDQSGKLRLSAREVLGNRASLSRLQSELGQVGRRWGLVRGESATLTKAAHETVGVRRAKLSRVPLVGIPDPVPEKVGLLDGRKAAEEYRAKAAQAIELGNRALLAARDADENAEKLKKEKAAQAREIARLRDENARLKEATAALRALDLVDVMQSLGYEIDKVEGKETVFKTASGHVSINRQEHIFSCDWSRGGRGAIDLVMQVEAVDYVRAREILETRVGSGAALRATVEDARMQPPVKKLTLDEEIALRATPMPSADRAREYLIQRGIDQYFVDAGIKAGRIWENQHGAVCFACLDANNRQTGCMIRATRGAFKQTLGKVSRGLKLRIGKDGEYPPLQVVCESPIDALSVASLGKQYGWPLSDSAVIYGLGGVNTLPADLDRPGVISFFDADPAGKRGSKKCLYTPPRALSRVLPSGAFVESSDPVKDWNDVLRLGAERAKIVWDYAMKLIESKILGTPAPELLTEKDAQYLENYKTAAQIKDSKKSKNQDFRVGPKIG